MTPEELQALEAYLASPHIAAAYNYGSGPSYLDADSNLYQRADQRLNFTTDILKASGLYLSDLLGLQEPPEDPGMFEEPEIFRSDLAAAYAGNPFMAQAMEDIAAGRVDPVTAANVLYARTQMNPDDEDYIDPAYLPQRITQGTFNEETGTDLASIQSVLQQYAEDMSRTNREMAQADMGRAAHNQLVDQYRSYYEPTSGFELAGIDPTLSRDKFIQDRSQRARRDVDMHNLDQYVQAQESARPNFRQQATENFEKVFKPAPRNDWERRWNDAAADALEASWKPSAVVNTPQAQPRPGTQISDHMRGLLTERAERHAGRMYDAAGSHSKSSQFEQDNRKKLEAVYSLLFGESPR